MVPPLKELGLKVLLEPGRFLTGNAGILVTEVQYVKDNPFKKFVVVDAAMNDLIRPALYEAYHEIPPVRDTEETLRGDVVGPICESGDFLAAGPRPAGGAGRATCWRCGARAPTRFAMASNYNSRPRAAEVMVVRRPGGSACGTRETTGRTWWRGERIPAMEATWYEREGEPVELRPCLKALHSNRHALRPRTGRG